MWYLCACMEPFTSEFEDSIDCKDNNQCNEEDLFTKQIWLTEPINNPGSPFHKWTDLELFNSNSTNNYYNSCWAYFDENKKWKIGGSFSNFTIINKYGYNNQLRLFLWEDIAVPIDDPCRFGSEFQVMIDVNTMLFTFLCSNKIIGGSALIYRDFSNTYASLQCPILVL